MKGDKERWIENECEEECVRMRDGGSGEIDSWWVRGGFSESEPKWREVASHCCGGRGCGGETWGRDFKTNLDVNSHTSQLCSDPETTLLYPRAGEQIPGMMPAGHRGLLLFFGAFFAYKSPRRLKILWKVSSVRLEWGSFIFAKFHQKRKHQDRRQSCWRVSTTWTLRGEKEFRVTMAISSLMMVCVSASLQTSNHETGLRTFWMRSQNSRSRGGTSRLSADLFTSPYRWRGETLGCPLMMWR